MAAFILQLFHKFEKNTAEGTWNIPCKWLKYERDETQQIEMRNNSNEAASQQQNLHHTLLSQVIHMHSS